MFSIQNKSTSQLLALTVWLSIFTVLYNMLEGLVSIYFGQADDTLVLFGFGLDSFVEVISGLGILHMVTRMRNHNVTKRDQFETTALRITGASFYLLSIGLIAGSIISLISQSQPQSTMIGVIIACISLLTMYFLMSAKLQVGQTLKSDPIIADAKCTKTCFYLSLILLISSGLYELFELQYIDELGSLGIAWFAYSEGKEAFEKARDKELICKHCS